MLLYQATIAGAAQFTGAAAATGLCTFGGQGYDPNQANFSTDIAVILIGYSYDTEGNPPTAHDILIELFNPAGGAAASERVLLEVAGAPANAPPNAPTRASLVNACGSAGLVVPKNADNVTWQFRVITANKAEQATINVWYQLRQLQ